MLEPNANAAAKTFQESIYEQGIPATSFESADVHKEYERLAAKGVEFTMKPTKTPYGTIATFDDTCGNLINMHQV